MADPACQLLDLALAECGRPATLAASSRSTPGSFWQCWAACSRPHFDALMSEVRWMMPEWSDTYDPRDVCSRWFAERRADRRAS